MAKNSFVAEVTLKDYENNVNAMKNIINLNK